MKRVDLVASIIILAFSAVAFAWLIPYFISAKHDAGDLSPSLIPSLSMGVLALTAMLLGISAWQKQDDSYQDIQEGEEGDSLSFGIRETGDLLLWLIASGIIWLLLKYVGFEVAAGIAIAAGTIYGGIRNPIVVILAALIIPQVIDKAVWYWLQVMLP